MSETVNTTVHTENTVEIPKGGYVKIVLEQQVSLFFIYIYNVYVVD